MATRSKSAKETMEIPQEMSSFFNSLIEPLVTKASMKDEIIATPNKKIEEQSKIIDNLKSELAVKDKVIENLTIKCDDNEQYSRRICLRVNGIEYDEKTKEDIEDVVAKRFEKEKIPFKKEEIDRIHRIGRPVIDQ